MLPNFDTLLTKMSQNCNITLSLRQFQQEIAYIFKTKPTKLYKLLALKNNLLPSYLFKVSHSDIFLTIE